MADKALNERSRRRRGLRGKTEETPVENLEADYEDEDEDDSQERSLSERKGRATPGRRTQEVAITKSEGNFITRRLRGVVEYFEGVRSEIAKVVWPTREETRRLTIIVLVTTITSSIVLGILSLIFNDVIVLGIRNPIIFGLILIVVIAGFVYYLRQSNRRTGSF